MPARHDEEAAPPVQRVELLIGHAAGERDGVSKAEARGHRLEARPIVTIADNPEPRVRVALEDARPGVEQQLVSFVAFIGRQPADDEGRRFKRHGDVRRARRKPGVTDVNRHAGELRIRVPEALGGVPRDCHETSDAQRPALGEPQRHPRFNSAEDIRHPRAAPGHQARHRREMDMSTDDERVAIASEEQAKSERDETQPVASGGMPACAAVNRVNRVVVQAQDDHGFRQHGRDLSRQARHPVGAEHVRRQQDRSKRRGHPARLTPSPWETSASYSRRMARPMSSQANARRTQARPRSPIARASSGRSSRRASAAAIAATS